MIWLPIVVFVVLCVTGIVALVHGLVENEAGEAVFGLAWAVLCVGCLYILWPYTMA